MRRHLWILTAGWAIALPAVAGEYHGFARIERNEFASVIPASPVSKLVNLKPYWLQRLPVTNADFLAFVRANPKWRRDRVPSLFADVGYLKHWNGPASLPENAARSPVVNVSWFAAMAYCEAQQARLPTWHEWEWAAAADRKQLDARADPAWRQQILNWYSQTGGTLLRDVGSAEPNRHGIYDLHGMIWEWVQDHGALMVSSDNREQGDPDVMKFCGTGALSMEQKENYAVLMRVAMLSSLEANNTTANVGFRCARDIKGPK